MYYLGGFFHGFAATARRRRKQDRRLKPADFDSQNSLRWPACKTSTTTLDDVWKGI
jgi:hypothetical protein